MKSLCFGGLLRDSVSNEKSNMNYQLSSDPPVVESSLYAKEQKHLWKSEDFTIDVLDDYEFHSVLRNGAISEYLVYNSPFKLPILKNQSFSGQSKTMTKSKRNFWKKTVKSETKQSNIRKEFYETSSRNKVEYERQHKVFPKREINSPYRLVMKSPCKKLPPISKSFEESETSFEIFPMNKPEENELVIKKRYFPKRLKNIKKKRFSKTKPRNLLNGSVYIG